MRLVPAVQQQMVLEVRLLREAAVADVALVGPRPVVDVHVRLEIPRRRERLGAQRTLVRLLLKKSERTVRVTPCSKTYELILRLEPVDHSKKHSQKNMQNHTKNNTSAARTLL